MKANPPTAVRRRLAAIVVADIAGYSRLMGEDEEAILLEMQQLRFSLVDPTIGKQHPDVRKSC